MKSTIVPVKNIISLNVACDKLINRPLGTPGLGLVYGRPGLGKSTAMAWCVSENDGVYVRAVRCCTPLSLLKDICRELGLDEPRSSRDALRAITDDLKKEPRIFFIDEADYLMDRIDLVETVRDIHDESGAPVTLAPKEGYDLPAEPSSAQQAGAWKGIGITQEQFDRDIPPYLKKP